MIEAGANEVQDEIMLEAIRIGHESIKGLVRFISGIASEIGKAKFSYESCDVPEEAFALLRSTWEDMRNAVLSDDKSVRDGQVCGVDRESSRLSFRK